MTCFQLFLPHFALRRPSSSLLAVIYATASSRGVKGGCVWLPKEQPWAEAVRALHCRGGGRICPRSPREGTENLRKRLLSPSPEVGTARQLLVPARAGLGVGDPRPPQPDSHDAAAHKSNSNQQ